jgi:hypothetical protein
MKIEIRKFPVRSGINTKIAAQLSETFVSSILKILSITLKKVSKAQLTKNFTNLEILLPSLLRSKVIVINLNEILKQK